MMAATVKIKQEPVDVGDLESSIMEMCRKNPKGISDDDIKNVMPQSNIEQRKAALNKLLELKQIAPYTEGKKLIFRLVDDTNSSTKGDTHDEKLVYQIIEKAANKGIWMKDIRVMSSLPAPQINKILKNFEKQNLIKSVKSVSAAKKKVYMLYGLEPDASVIGGTFYSEQEFDSEFADLLNETCAKFLQQKAAIAQSSQSGPIAQRNAAYTSPQEVLQYISELRISKVQLQIDDVEKILNTLMYDGKVERTVSSSADGGDLVKLYRYVNPMIGPTGLMRVPCGVCPVVAECHIGGLVSPSTCVYMNDWINF